MDLLLIFTSCFWILCFLLRPTLSFSSMSAFVLINVSYGRSCYQCIFKFHIWFRTSHIHVDYQMYSLSQLYLSTKYYLYHNTFFFCDDIFEDIHHGLREVEILLYLFLLLHIYHEYIFIFTKQTSSLCYTW